MGPVSTVESGSSNARTSSLSDAKACHIAKEMETISKDKVPNTETKHHNCEAKENEKQLHKDRPDAAIPACHLHILKGHEHEPQLA